MTKKHDHMLEYLMTVEERQRAARRFDRKEKWHKRWAEVRAWVRSLIWY